MIGDKQFPKLTPLQRLVIRTTGLVADRQVAQFLRISESDLEMLQAELGLPKMPVCDAERAFPIVMRRLHDLLPEQQIASLLGLSLDQCRQKSLDMDFLDVKLGARPDSCPQLSLKAETQQAAEAFRASSSDLLSAVGNGEQLFEFLDAMNVPEPPSADECSSDAPLRIRMMHSYVGSHGDFLLSGEEFYSDGILSRMQNRGVNAGWMPALLRDMAPSDVFPEFGKGHQQRIANLRKQVEKASRYGIRLFLYFNEPRFMPAEFFVNHPDTRGAAAHLPGYYGMCTSNSQVRQWMQQATAFIFRQVPELGGVVLITASENETNCFSHRNTSSPDACPRCAARGTEAALTDCANLMSAGVTDSCIKDACITDPGITDPGITDPGITDPGITDPGITDPGVGETSTRHEPEVIQWMWAWDNILDEDRAIKAINQLDPKVRVMVDWAKNTPYELFGKKAAIGEYTLAYVRPSEYAQCVIQEARSHNSQVLSKCAVVSTVEMNALPYLPVLANVQTLLKEHIARQMDGMLGCWIFGAYPGRNMEMFSLLGCANPVEALAQKYYGNGADEAMAAWQCFSDGMAFYPSSVVTLYYSALNPGPGLKLPLSPEPWRWGMVGMATERLEEASGPFGAEVMIKGFRKLAEYFEAGLRHLKLALENADHPEWQAENLRDYGICEACWRHFQSAANYSQFILDRDRWLANPSEESARNDAVQMLQAELANSEGMLRLAAADSRIGYEGSIGYFYTPMEIVEKIYELRSSICEMTAE